jgi:hypothetical protein
MVTSIKVKRIEGKELVHIDSLCETSPATNKYLQRTLHYMMLVGTHVPDEYQIQAGALAVLLLKEPTVVDLEIWRIDNNGDWIADATVETARGHRLRRGEGKTPVEALNNLAVDVLRS